MTKWLILAFALAACGTDALEAARGSAVGSIVVQTAAGPVLVLRDGVEASSKRGTNHWQGDRLRAVDVATGAKLGVKVFQDLGDPDAFDMGAKGVCMPASVGRVWCQLGPRLALLGVPAFDVIAYTDDLATKAAMAKPAINKWKMDGAAVVQLLIDGRAERIDPATLAVTAASGDGISTSPGSLGAKRAQACHEQRRLALPHGQQATFGDGARRPLIVGKASLYGDPPTNTTPVTPTTPTYLGDPSFITVASNPALMLVLSASTLASSAPLVLARVDLSGPPKELWSVSIGADSCEIVEESGALLVVTTRGGGPAKPNRALAIDRETGAVKWTFAM